MGLIYPFRDVDKLVLFVKNSVDRQTCTEMRKVANTERKGTSSGGFVQ